MGEGRPRFPLTELNKHCAEQDWLRKEAKRRKNHVINKLCTQSRYPYTEHLSLPEIVCLRDSYAGKRKSKSVVEENTNYSRLFDIEIGWDQRAHRSDRMFQRDIQLSGRQEDRCRTVPMTVNTIYGLKQGNFYDLITGDYPKLATLTKNYRLPNQVGTLPPFENMYRPGPDFSLSRRHGGYTI